MAANTFAWILRLVDSLDPSSSSISEEDLREIRRIAEDLEELEQMAGSMEAVLVDAEERQVREESVRLWLRDMRDLTHQVQYLRDVYDYELVAGEVERAYGDTSSPAGDARKEFDDEVRSPISRSLLPLLDASFRGKIADEVRRIKRRCDAVERRRNSLQLRETDGKRLLSDDSVARRSPSSSFPSDPVFLGREQEMRKLNTMLLADHADGHSNVEVIAVVGMGGVGKTTLAQHTFRDPQIVSGFHKMGWVYVSPDFDIVRLTKAMIESLSEESCPYSELSPMQEMVTRLVKKKKVLLVLDDVWNADIGDWDVFIAPIVYCASTGSKILITTRLKEAANVAATARSISLKSLSEDKGWELLKRHAMPKNVADVRNLEELEEIGRLIVKKCGSLPLAVKVLGGLLRSHGCSVTGWRSVLNSSLLDYGIEGSKQILGSLYLSYLYLSPKLKTCFKCCSIFPRNMIPAVDLENYLMAHDLVNDREEAKKCLGDLESRSFVRSEGTWVRMHDHMYDLAQYISDEKHVSLRCKGGLLDQQPEDHVLPIPHARVEISLASDLDLKLTEKRTLWMDIDTVVRAGARADMAMLRICGSVGRFLRVLIVSCKSETASNIEVNLNSLKCLRVFRFEGPSPIPPWIFCLYNLRHLHVNNQNFRGIDYICVLKNLQSIVLSSHGLTSLPESICMLSNLQELKLVGCSRLEKLPESLSKLMKLRELSLEGCSRLKELPRGIVSLTGLRSLNLLRAGISSMPKGFGGLTQLTYLSDYFIGSGSGQAGLNELNNLVHLEGDTSISFPCKAALWEEDVMQDNTLGRMECIQRLSLYWGDRRASPFSLSDEHNFEHKGRFHRRHDRSSERRSLRSLPNPSGESLEFIRHNCRLPRCPGSSFRNSKGQSKSLTEQTKDERQQEQVLEGLRPHCNISEMYVSDYRGQKLASWMGSQFYVKLVRLELRKMDYCISLSPIHELPSLSYLGISSMHLLQEIVPDQNPAIGIENAETSQRPFFPELQKLYIDRCCNLKSLHLETAPSLTEVEVCCCKKLKNIELPHYMGSSYRSVSIGNCPEIAMSRALRRSWLILDKLSSLHMHYKKGIEEVRSRRSNNT